MSIGYLDLNDSNLQLWHGQYHLRSPGYALLEGEQYVFGNAARAAARLRPRDVNTRYWWQLNSQPLQPALGSARHHADLVHAHLLALHREAGTPGELLFATSGSTQREQLALLLGIAQSCPFDAIGLVNRSVALASLYPGPEQLFHLELGLHQAVISELRRSADQLELTRVVPLPGCGVLQLQERLVEIIAGAFIRQTRFDPRRKATTEQQLYDALPDTLLALQGQGEISMEVSGYHARIDQRELQEASRRLFDGVSEVLGPGAANQRLLVDPIPALIPGLRQQFAQLVALAADDLPQALQHHQPQLLQREQALSLVTSLPLLQQHHPQAATTAVPTAQTIAPPPAPTHLLRGCTAKALASEGTELGPGWELYRDAQGWRLRGSGDSALRVNSETAVAGQPIICGDRIAVNDQPEALVIVVENPER